MVLGLGFGLGVFGDRWVKTVVGTEGQRLLHFGHWSWVVGVVPFLDRSRPFAEEPPPTPPPAQKTKSERE